MVFMWIAHGVVAHPRPCLPFQPLWLHEAGSETFVERDPSAYVEMHRCSIECWISCESPLLWSHLLCVSYFCDADHDAITANSPAFFFVDPFGAATKITPTRSLSSLQVTAKRYLGGVWAGEEGTSLATKEVPALEHLLSMAVSLRSELQSSPLMQDTAQQTSRQVKIASQKSGHCKILPHVAASSDERNEKKTTSASKKIKNYAQSARGPTESIRRDDVQCRLDSLLPGLLDLPTAELECLRKERREEKRMGPEGSRR